MIRPAGFRMNEETSSTNHFQRDTGGGAELELAIVEFDAMVVALRKEGVHLIVFQDDPTTDTPDALFPNNWVSFHRDGRVVQYPMSTPNRRLERRGELIEALERMHGFSILERVDLTSHEVQGAFLEGTGSVVLDRKHKVAYAAIGPRTDRGLFEIYCQRMGFEALSFEALMTTEGRRVPIYHTNVMMTVGTGWAAICLDSIASEDSRVWVERRLKKSGLEVILLTQPQVASFAGNMLEVRDRDGASIIVLSRRAHDKLRKDQLQRLRRYGRLVIIDIDVIETFGGGSVRCMIAEVFLPHNSSAGGEML